MSSNANSFDIFFQTKKIGCNNCKDGRIKCDRQKPICSICRRRGLQCDYSLRLKWVDNEQLGSTYNPTQAYQPPRLKRTKRKKEPDSAATLQPAPKKSKQQAASSLNSPPSTPSSSNTYIKSTPALTQEAEAMIQRFQQKQRSFFSTASNTSSPNSPITASFDDLLSVFSVNPQHPNNIETQQVPYTIKEEIHGTTTATTTTIKLDPTPPTPSSEIDLIDDLFHSASPNTQNESNIVSHGYQNTGAINETSSLLTENISFDDSSTITTITTPTSRHKELQIDYHNPKIIHHPLIRTALGVASKISEQLSDPLVSGIFNHYVEFTCPSLDPEHPSVDQNDSIKYYLPVAINSPAAFHGLLALSCLQLRERDPKYSQHAVIHRECSISHLTASWKNGKGILDPAILAAILCQITLDVMDPRSLLWKSYLKLCREHIIKIFLAGGPNIAYYHWFLASRIVKYDMFACLVDLHKPIMSIRAFENNPSLESRLDSVWNVPSKWLLLTAHCCYHASLLNGEYNNRNPNEEPCSVENLVQARQEMAYIFNYLSINRPFNKGPTDGDKNDVVELWKIATSMVYKLQMHTMPAPIDLDIEFEVPIRRPDQMPEIQQELSQAINILKGFQTTSFHGTALAWPLLIFVMTAFSRPDRLFLRDIITQLWKNLRITTFSEILKRAIKLWVHSSNDASNNIPLEASLNSNETIFESVEDELAFLQNTYYDFFLDMDANYSTNDDDYTFGKNISGREYYKRSLSCIDILFA